MAPPLLRDTKRRVLGGVAAGIAEHLNVDPLLIRLAFVLLAFLHGLGVLLYLIAWVAIPSAPRQPRAGASTFDAGGGSSGGHGGAASGGAAADANASSRNDRAPAEPHGGQRVLGYILIALGALFLLDRFSWWRWPRWGSIFSWWPLALIAAGGVMIFRGRSNSRT